MDEEDLIGEVLDIPLDRVIDVAPWDAKLTRGVSVTWLQNATRLNHYSIREKLRDCPTIGVTTKNGPVYDLNIAMQYILGNNIDIARYMRTLKPTEMPVILQKDFWGAQSLKLKYLEEAKDLWRTESVMEVFTETFKTLRESIKLWVTDLERETGITKPQKDLLYRLTDELQNKMHDNLVEYARKTATQSMETEEIE